MCSNVINPRLSQLTCVCSFSVNLRACFLSDVAMSKNSKVLNLKDKMSDNEMDLSLGNLSEVPVRELVGSRLTDVVVLECNYIKFITKVLLPH